MTTTKKITRAPARESSLATILKLIVQAAWAFLMLGWLSIKWAWRTTAAVIRFVLSAVLGFCGWISRNPQRSHLEGSLPHIAIVMAIVAAAWVWTPLSQWIDEVPEADAVLNSIPVEADPGAAPKGTYETGPLAGRMAADLYARYLGYDPAQPIPASIKIDWANQLNAQWQMKLSRKRGVSETAQRAAEELTTEYATSDPQQTSLAAYQYAADMVAQENCSRLDWDSVRREYRLTVREGKLLRRLSCNLRGRSLTAYAMTELLPSTDGELNRDYLDFVLYHGGRRFVEALPAVYDEYTSFGPYQFTYYALYETNGKRHGASRVNQHLPTALQIRDSVIYLRGDDHHRAGHLFAIHNLALGIRKLKSEEVQTLERIGGPRGAELVQYIAVAHNKPANGRRYLRDWLKAGGSGTFLSYCRNKASRLYATKTRNNYRALSPTVSTPGS